MSSFMDNIKNWTKNKSHQLTDSIHNLTAKTSISVDDLATIILLHPKTQMETKEYLGIIFNECTLKLGDFVYYLETKGKEHEQTLEIIVKENDDIFSSYQSYKDNRNKITVPEQILNLNDVNIH